MDRFQMVTLIIHYMSICCHTLRILVPTEFGVPISPFCTYPLQGHRTELKRHEFQFFLMTENFTPKLNRLGWFDCNTRL